MEDSFSLRGLIRVYAWPDVRPDMRHWPDWWRKLPRREQERYLVAEEHNLITTNGRTQLCNYFGQGAGTLPLFAEYFSVGTGAIASVSASDTSMASELFRLQPSSAGATGTTENVLFNFNTTDAVGTWTNAGMWGNGATSTLGTGTLLTHSLLSYVKNNSTQVTVQYNFTLSFS